MNVLERYYKNQIKSTHVVTLVMLLKSGVDYKDIRTTANVTRLRNDRDLKPSGDFTYFIESTLLGEKYVIVTSEGKRIRAPKEDRTELVLGYIKKLPNNLGFLEWLSSSKYMEDITDITFQKGLVGLKEKLHDNGYVKADLNLYKILREEQGINELIPLNEINPDIEYYYIIYLQECRYLPILDMRVHVKTMVKDSIYKKVEEEVGLDFVNDISLTQIMWNVPYLKAYYERICE